MEIINFKMIYSSNDSDDSLKNLILIRNNDVLYPYYQYKHNRNDAYTSDLLKEDGIFHLFPEDMTIEKLIDFSTKEYDWHFDGSDLNMNIVESFRYMGNIIGYPYTLRFLKFNPFNTIERMRNTINGYGLTDCLYTDFEMILLKNESDYLKAKTLLNIDGIPNE